MNSSREFAYSPDGDAKQPADGLPFVPIILSQAGREVSGLGLIDSGATINVLPFEIGLELDLVWEEQNFPLQLVGALREAPAFGVLLVGRVEPFACTHMDMSYETNRA